MTTRDDIETATEIFDTVAALNEKILEAARKGLDVAIDVQSIQTPGIGFPVVEAYVARPITFAATTFSKSGMDAKLERII